MTSRLAAASRSWGRRGARLCFGARVMQHTLLIAQTSRSSSMESDQPSSLTTPFLTPKRLSKRCVHKVSMPPTDPSLS